MKIKMKANSAELSMNEVFEKYQRYNKLRNLSEYSIIHKEDSQKKFTQFLGVDDFKISEVNSELVEEFVFSLQGQGLKVVTINTYLRSLKAFLNWASKNGYLDTVAVPKLKEEETVKEVYSQKQLEALLKKPNISSCSFNEYRTWVIVNYFLATGNRLNTCINLKIGDIDFENEYITLKVTKSKKQQLIPLSRALKGVLVEYLSIRGGEESDYLFCTEDGVQLKRATLSNSIYKYNKTRGVEMTSIHAFRHTFAISSVRNGVDVFKLQKLMGHSDINTTRIYVNLASEDLKVDYEKFNPLDVYMNNTISKQIKMK